MSKSLVIAEKPSVAQDIVRALTPVYGKFEKHEDHFENDRYVVTSAVITPYTMNFVSVCPESAIQKANSTTARHPM